MVEHNIKRYVCAIIILFLACFVATCAFKGSHDAGISGIFNAMSTSMSTTAVIVTLFVSWAWKFRIFRGWLVPYPNLNGDWEGAIKYNYNGQDTSRRIKIHIRQTFTSIKVEFSTKESISKNFCGSFNIDKNRGEKQLIYSYFNEPEVKFRERSPLHYGTAKLDISKDDKSMKGEYWTNRKSDGSISLKKIK